MLVYPENGHLNVMMTTETFSGLICEWTGVVQVCYIFH